MVTKSAAFLGGVVQILSYRHWVWGGISKWKNKDGLTFSLLKLWHSTDHQKVAQYKKGGASVPSTLNVHHGEKILLEMLKNKMCNCSGALLLTSRHPTQYTPLIHCEIVWSMITSDPPEAKVWDEPTLSKLSFSRSCCFIWPSTMGNQHDTAMASLAETKMYCSGCFARQIQH